MKLYVVPTPIGNLEDITIRAINILKSVKFIACEDTRRIQVLLKHYNIEGKTLLSYYHPKEAIQIRKIISLIRKDEDVALVSDAGTPSISDPGFKLINMYKRRYTCRSTPWTLRTYYSISRFWTSNP
jgi:Predicted methyltransferases